MTFYCLLSPDVRYFHWYYQLQSLRRCSNQRTFCVAFSIASIRDIVSEAFSKVVVETPNNLYLLKKIHIKNQDTSDTHLLYSTRKGSIRYNIEMGQSRLNKKLFVSMHPQ